MVLSLGGKPICIECKDFDLSSIFDVLSFEKSSRKAVEYLFDIGCSHSFVVDSLLSLSL